MEQERSVLSSDSGSAPIRPGQEAFEHFYEREFSQVAALAYVLTGRRDVAEDLAQEAFMAALRGWDRVAGYDKPGAWVRRVVANRAVSFRRRRMTELKSLPRLIGSSPHAPVGEMDAEASEVWAAVRALPRRQAQVVSLRYLDDLPLNEIGEILGCSPGTVKTHLARARRRLGDVLGVQVVEEVGDDAG